MNDPITYTWKCRIEELIHINNCKYKCYFRRTFFVPRLIILDFLNITIAKFFQTQFRHQVRSEI